MAACDDFRASFGEDLPICWLCQALKERDEAREELVWKRICPKCEEHYSDPNDLEECPVCETQTRNNRLSETLQEIWDAAEQETGNWRDVGALFAKLRKEREEARKGVRMMGEELNRVSGDLHATLIECGQAERERDEVRGDVEHLRNSLYDLEERVIQLIRERDEALQKSTWKMWCICDYCGFAVTEEQALRRDPDDALEILEEER